MLRYELEFVISAYDLKIDLLRDAIAAFGDGIEVAELSNERLSRYSDFRVNISTLDPTVIFDACAEIGRIKSVKIRERES